MADFDTVIQSQANGDLILNYDQADSLDLKTSHIAKKQALEREKRRERTMAQYEKDRKLREEQLKEGKKMKELERTIRKYKEIMKNDFESNKTRGKNFKHQNRNSSSKYSKYDLLLQIYLIIS